MRFLICIALIAGLVPLSAQTDLDDFMARVLARRDENWKKLQQYVLEERETFQLLGPGAAPLYGFRRDYSWFMRDGAFIRSPVRADGVAIDEDDRRRAEEEWVKEIKASIEPGFVTSAYFMKFKFDPGQYALAGRETFDGREVLRIEYYPTKLFTEGRTRSNRRVRDKDPQVDEKMNKASLVTLWVDPAEHQILQYAFDNIDMDFLPGRSLVRADTVQASMRMGEAFAGVWLPRSLGMRFGATLAIGTVTARYDVEYHDYRLATVTTRVR
jgi:hypothetical protein